MQPGWTCFFQTSRDKGRCWFGFLSRAFIRQHAYPCASVFGAFRFLGERRSFLSLLYNRPRKYLTGCYRFTNCRGKNCCGSAVDCHIPSCISQKIVNRWGYLCFPLKPFAKGKHISNLQVIRFRRRTTWSLAAAGLFCRS